MRDRSGVACALRRLHRLIPVQTERFAAKQAGRWNALQRHHVQRLREL
jgi:hypothetical protein